MCEMYLGKIITCSSQSRLVSLCSRHRKCSWMNFTVCSISGLSLPSDSNLLCHGAFYIKKTKGFSHTASETSQNGGTAFQTWPRCDQHYSNIQLPSHCISKAFAKLDFQSFCFAFVINVIYLFIRLTKPYVKYALN